jgi:hypothetical protein
MGPVTLITCPRLGAARRFGLRRARSNVVLAMRVEVFLRGGLGPTFLPETVVPAATPAVYLNCCSLAEPGIVTWDGLTRLARIHRSSRLMAKQAGFGASQ